MRSSRIRDLITSTLQSDNHGKTFSDIRAFFRRISIQTELSRISITHRIVVLCLIYIFLYYYVGNKTLVIRYLYSTCKLNIERYTTRCSGNSVWGDFTPGTWTEESLQEKNNFEFFFCIDKLNVVRRDNTDK